LPTSDDIRGDHIEKVDLQKVKLKNELFKKSPQICQKCVLKRDPEEGQPSIESVSSFSSS
jgi:hypothetical protein